MRFHWRRRGTLATTVVPLTDHIVLSAVDAEEITTSGLVIPDSIKEKPQHGNVVAVGPGKMNEAGTMETIELKAGDRILYQKYTGQEITVDKQEYIVIRFQDVLARLEEDGVAAAGTRARGRK
ncbi:MAG: co-chaperone GroES [Chloroflexi bacterium]|nr:MAG: co-chaperone GroES [Chloroflexota bacterium]